MIVSMCEQEEKQSGDGDSAGVRIFPRESASYDLHAYPPLLSSAPPFDTGAINRLLLIAAHPKINPPQVKFWKQATATINSLGSLGLVIANQ